MSQTLFTVRTGITGTSSGDSSTTAWKVLRVTGIALDIIIAAACAAALRRCMLTLEAQRLRAKALLYKRTAVSLGLGLCVAAGWAAVMIHRSTAPLMTFGDSQWEAAWVPEAVWELIYFAIFTTVIMVWLPQASSYYQFYGEEIPATPRDESLGSPRYRVSRKKASSVPKPSKPSPIASPSSSREGLVVVSTGESAVTERKPRPLDVGRVSGSDRAVSDTDGIEMDAV
jgi:hypothetical protein